MLCGEHRVRRNGPSTTDTQESKNTSINQTPTTDRARRRQQPRNDLSRMVATQKQKATNPTIRSCFPLASFAFGHGPFACCCAHKYTFERLGICTATYLSYRVSFLPINQLILAFDAMPRSPPVPLHRAQPLPYVYIPRKHHSILLPPSPTN